MASSSACTLSQKEEEDMHGSVHAAGHSPVMPDQQWWVPGFRGGRHSSTRVSTPVVDGWACFGKTRGKLEIDSCQKHAK